MLIRDERSALALRLMVVADAAVVQATRTDPAVSRFQSWRPATVAEVEVHARNQVGVRPGHSPGVAQLVIEHRGEVIGDFGVVSVDPGRQVELGIVLTPDAQGRGIATRACGLLLDSLFASGIHRVIARVDPRNDRSLRLFERLGFRREGHEVECFWDEAFDEWTDEVCFAMLADEWREAAPR